MARFSQRQQFPINNNIPPSEIQWIDPFAQARRNSSLDDASIYTSINEQGLCCTSKTAIQAHRDSSSVSQADLDPHALQESGGRGDEETTSSRRRRSSVLVEIEADELPKPKKRRGKNKANAYIASNLARIKGSSHTSRYPQPAWLNIPEGKTIVHPPPFAFPAPQSQPISTGPPLLKREPASDPFAPPVPPSLSAIPRKGSIGKRATKRASLPCYNEESKEKMPALAISRRMDMQRAVSLERRHSVHTTSTLYSRTSVASLGDQTIGALPRTESPSLWFTPATPTTPMPIIAPVPIVGLSNMNFSLPGSTTDFPPDTLPSDPTTVFPLDPNFLAQVFSSSVNPACPNTAAPSGQQLLPHIGQDAVPPLSTRSCTIPNEPAPALGLPSVPAFLSTSNTSLQVPPTSQVPQMDVSRSSSPLIRRWSSPDIHLAALPATPPVITMSGGPCYQPAASQQAQRAVSQQASSTAMPPPPPPCVAPYLGVNYGPVSTEPALLWTAKQGYIKPPIAATKKIPPPLFTSDPLPLASSRVSAAEMALGLDPDAFKPVVFDGSRLFGSTGINDPFLAAFGAPFFPVVKDQSAPVDCDTSKADIVKDHTLLAPRAVPILSPYTDYQAEPLGSSSNPTYTYEGRYRFTTPLRPLGFPQYGEQHNI